MSDTRGSSLRTLGTLRAADGAGVVRIADRYDTGADDLWTALTDPQRLARWYGEVAGDLREGGRFTVYLSGPDLDAEGTVDECDAPRRLKITTQETAESAARGSGPVHVDTIEATLTPVGEQTDLVIEIRGLPLDNLASYGVGWQLHAESLSSYLAGREGPDVEQRWSELAGSYDEMASALG